MRWWQNVHFSTTPAGRTETSLPDDAEYHQFLVERIKGSWELRVGSNGERGLKGERLAGFLASIEDFRINMNRLISRGYPEDALRVALLQGLVDRKTLASQKKVAEIAEIIEASGFHSVEIGTDEEHGVSRIAFVSRRDGVEREVEFGMDLVTTAEYRALTRNKAGLKAIESADFALSAGEDVFVYEGLEEAIEGVYVQAKKGLSVQRYKGLGEMNADQLWETTMDPEKRRLLRVTIEDNVAADDIFTTLMGDQVEPRRAFIQKNALDVRNLDV